MVCVCVCVCVCVDTVSVGGFSCLEEHLQFVKNKNVFFNV